MGEARGCMDEIRAGGWVAVRPIAEIATTLDSDGALDGLPFMPEMLPFAGRTFRVAQRARRTCVHPPQIPLPQLTDAVVLSDLRCTGKAHGGCELGCMLFWRTAWLRPADAAPSEPSPADTPLDTAPAHVELPVRQPGSTDRFRCQGTELPRVSTPGPPLWRPGQYLQFLRDRTHTPLQLATMFGRMSTRIIMRRIAPGRPGARSGGPGRDASWGAQPGEWVRVKSRQEIESTLDDSGKLNGLAFGGDMAVDCGKTLQVQQRVRHIMDERTGRLRGVKDTVILKDSVCDRYLGCARGMPILWREAWLERVEDRDGAAWTA